MTGGARRRRSAPKVWRLSRVWRADCRVELGSGSLLASSGSTPGKATLESKKCEGHGHTHHSYAIWTVNLRHRQETGAPE
jgi:hypothetical protein